MKSIDAESESHEPRRDESSRDNEIMGTGSCNVAGCGCQAFSAAPGGSGTHCIGRNSAGGTCNHLKDEHN
jgi:hypothetical protein